MRYLYKNRFVFIFIFAVLSLLLGISLFFVPTTKSAQDGSNAGWRKLQVTFYIKWKNPNGTTGTGNYKNTSGDSIAQSCGSLYATATDNGSKSGWSSSGTTGTITTLSGGSVTAWFKSDDWVDSSYNCNIDGHASSASGFSYSWPDNVYGYNFSGSSPMFNSTTSESLTCTFYPYSYTIYYYVNGGIWPDGTTSKTQSTYRLERYSVPSQPSRTGYSFAGFKTSSSSGTTITSSSIFEGDTSIYANWTANQYTISFDQQKGSGGTTSITATYGSTPPSITVPTRTGYTFQGYYTSSDGSGTQYYNSRGAGTRAYTIAGPATLYAYWTANTYTITLNQNSATTNGTTSVSATYESTKLFSITNPKRTGYIFKGWTSSQNGTTYVINTSGSLNASVSGYTNSSGQWQKASATTLYAKWELETYTLNFNAGDGTASMGSLSVSYGQSLTSSTDPRWPYATLAGNIFKGWVYGGTTYTSYTVPDLTSGTEGTTSITFTASYEKETYTINFNGGLSNRGVAGTPTATSIVVTYGNTYTSSTTPAWPSATLTGYIFNGFMYNGSTYKTSYTANTDYTPNAEGTTSVTFTASWTPITYKLLFNGNGGKTTAGATTYYQTNDSATAGITSSSNTMTNLTYDVTYTLLDNAFIRKNYLFLGWSTSSTATSATYTNKQTRDNLTTTNGETVTYYAVWRDTYANHYSTPSGSGTSGDPYLISSASNLAWISNRAENGQSTSIYCKQTANIDLSAYEWLPIGNGTNYFLGNYDGNGYTIKNMKINRISGINRRYLGLFGFVAGDTSVIQNVRIIGDTTIVTGSGSSWFVGSVAGYITGKAKILNCTNFNNVTSGNDNVGGIVGSARGTNTISGCINYGDVTGSLWVGGIVGDTGSNVTISNCYVNANVKATSNYNSYGGCCGGIVGSNTTGTLNISACAFEGDLLYGGEGSQTYQGSIVGRALGTVKISNCYADANMTTTNNYGLYSGTATVTDCVFVTNSTKRCKGSSFTNWLITSDSRPVPAGLTWLATGGTKVTSSSQITALGYTLVS